MVVSCVFYVCLSVSERLSVGYRWYDTHLVQPAFPFGHGLSYTTFAYTGIEVTPPAPDAPPDVVAVVQCAVTNSGPVAGQEGMVVWLCGCVCVCVCVCEIGRAHV